MADSDKEKQLEQATRLQTLWLDHMETLLKSGGITPTDLKTLYTFFKDNGWTVDPHSLPKNLRDKLTRQDPRKFDDDDMDVVGRIA